MPKIQSYPVLDFSGGVVRNKSVFEMNKNELLDARNCLVDEKGRIIGRRGSHQVANTLSGTLENSFVFNRFVANSSTITSVLVNNNANPAVIRVLRGSELNGAITTATTTINVNFNGTNDATQFAASGTVEIEGDLIAYSSRNGTQLLGVTGITSSHASGSAIHQWASITTTGSLDGRKGIYYAVLTNSSGAPILIINGFNAVWNQIADVDGVTTSAITGEPGGIFITTYRQRCYVAGDGGSGTNASVYRTSFSNINDATTWTSTDFFDVQSQNGDPITGFKVLNDVLWIFKFNSMHSYDEILLKERQTYVGAWNHKVIQEINGVLYTFCSSGIFASNGSQVTPIGRAVEQYWKNFQPIYNVSTGSADNIVVNTFSGIVNHHYLLYIYNITDPDTTNDVVLDYDTIKKSWTVHTGFTNIRHFLSTSKFRFGDNGFNVRPALFGGDTSGKYYRFLESKYINSQGTIYGNDLFQDLVSDTGVVTPVSFETPLYDLTHPDLYKQFKQFRGYAERGQWSIQYRVENENGISAYQPLGAIFKTNQVLQFPKEAQGWRIGFKGAAVSASLMPIFNGFVLENTEVISRS